MKETQWRTVPICTPSFATLARELGYVFYECIWCASPKKECHALKHGLELILMQANDVVLRPRDNCCSEEWLASELSSSACASHEAVHQTSLTSDIL